MTNYEIFKWPNAQGGCFVAATSKPWGASTGKRSTGLKGSTGKASTGLKGNRKLRQLRKALPITDTQFQKSLWYKLQPKTCKKHLRKTLSATQKGLFGYLLLRIKCIFSQNIQKLNNWAIQDSIFAHAFTKWLVRFVTLDCVKTDFKLIVAQQSGKGPNLKVVKWW